jgi:hypothetical protein
VQAIMARDGVRAEDLTQLMAEMRERLASGQDRLRAA